MTIREQNERLMRDEAFVKRLAEAESPAEIVALYKAKGIDVTEENAKAGFAFLHETDELDEAALEKVIGGNKTDFARLASIATAAAITVGIVTVSATPIGSVSVVAGIATAEE